MAEETGNGRSEQEIRMIERDKISPSPSIRANAIWNIIQSHKPRPTLWDVLCFGVETIGWAVESYPFLLTPIKQLNRLIYAVHYNSDTTFESFVTVDGEEKK